MKYSILIILSFVCSSLLYGQINTGNYDHLWNYTCQLDPFLRPVCWDANNKKPYPGFYEISGKEEVLSIFGEFIRVVGLEGVNFENTGENGKTLYSEQHQDGLFVCWHTSRSWSRLLNSFIPLRFEKYDYEGNLLFQHKDTLPDTKGVIGHRLMNQNSILIADGTEIIFYNNQGARLNTLTSPVDFSVNSFVYQISNDIVWIINDIGDAIKIDLSVRDVLETRIIGRNENIISIEKIEENNSMAVLFSDKIVRYDSSLNLLNSISITSYDFAKNKPWDFINESEVLIYGDDNQNHIIQLIDLSADSVVLQKSFQPEINLNISDASWIEYDNGYFYIFGSSQPERYVAYWEVLKIEIETMEVKRKWGENLRDSRPTDFLTVPTCYNFYSNDSLQILTYGVDMDAIGSDGWYEQRTILLKNRRDRSDTKFLGTAFNDLNLNCKREENEPLLDSIQFVQRGFGGTIRNQVFTNSVGQFYISAPWNSHPDLFNWEMVLPSSYSTCPVSLDTAWYQETDTIFVDFPIIDVNRCKHLKIESKMVEPLYWCYPNQFKVMIENPTDSIFQNVSVELEVDSTFIIDTLAHPEIQFEDGKYIIEISEIIENEKIELEINGIFQCGNFDDSSFKIETLVLPKTTCQEILSNKNPLSFNSTISSNCPDFYFNITSLRDLNICHSNTLHFTVRNVGNEDAKNLIIEIEMDSFFLNPRVNDFDFSLNGNILIIPIGDLGTWGSLQRSFSFELDCEASLDLKRGIKAKLYSENQCFQDGRFLGYDFEFENFLQLRDFYKIEYSQNSKEISSPFLNLPTEFHFIYSNASIDSLTKFQVTLNNIKPDFIDFDDFKAIPNGGELFIDSINNSITIVKEESSLEPKDDFAIGLEFLNCHYPDSILNEISFESIGEIQGKILEPFQLEKYERDLTFEDASINNPTTISFNQNGILEPVHIDLNDTIEIDFIIKNDSLDSYENLDFQIEFIGAQNEILIHEIKTQSNHSIFANGAELDIRFSNFEIQPDSAFNFSIKVHLHNNYPQNIDSIRVGYKSTFTKGCSYLENSYKEYQVKVKEISNSNDLNFNKNLLVYPNPSKTQVHFTFESPFAKPIQFELFNIAGQKVLFREVQDDFEIEKSELGTGIFFFEMKESGVVVERGKVIFL